jgi:hypothetical protein
VIAATAAPDDFSQISVMADFDRPDVSALTPRASTSWGLGSSESMAAGSKVLEKCSAHDCRFDVKQCFCSSPRPYHLLLLAKAPVHKLLNS